MTRLYLIGGIVAAFAVLLWMYHAEIRENEQLKISVKSAGETIAMMEKDRKDKESINTDLRQQREELEHEKARLARHLEQLPRTEAQRDCDHAATPDGYPQRMLEYARTQGPLSDSGSDMGAANSDPPGHRGSSDLRSGEKQGPD